MITIGIDPGFTGALCVMRTDENAPPKYDFYDMPLLESKTGKTILNIARLASIIRGYQQSGNPRIVLERVGSMKGQGVSSTFRFGEGYGIVQGVSGALGLAVHFITPQQWKKPLGLIGAEKDYARTLAIQRHPEVAHHLTRKKDIGRADAFWIAKHLGD